MIVPFWQHGLGVQTFWSIGNSPGSSDPASVTLKLRNGAGSLLTSQTAVLAPGDAWLLDTQEGWFAAGSNYGGGEIEVSFADPADPANQATMWEAIYGFYLGYQVGYPVELK